MNSFELSGGLNRQFRAIICENSEIILKSLNFLELGKETVADIFKWDDLNCSEEKVFEAAVAWARNSPNRSGVNSTNIDVDLKAELGELNKDIRFHILTGESFSKIYRAYPRLLEHSEHSDLFQFFTSQKKPETPIWNFDRAARSRRETCYLSIGQELAAMEIDHEVQKFTVDRLELILPKVDEIDETSKVIVEVYSGPESSPSKAEIPFVKFLHNSKAKKFIYHFEAPLVVERKTNVTSWLIVIGVSHPPVPKSHSLELHNFSKNSEHTGKIEFIKDEYMHNSAFAGIGFIIRFTYSSQK